MIRLATALVRAVTARALVTTLEPSRSGRSPRLACENRAMIGMARKPASTPRLRAHSAAKPARRARAEVTRSAARRQAEAVPPEDLAPAGAADAVDEAARRGRARARPAHGADLVAHRR